MNKYIKKISLFISFPLIFISCSRVDLLSNSYATSISLLTDYFDGNVQIYNRELIESIPYASSLIAFDNRSKSLIILETINRKESVWISSDNIRFKEIDGRINQTIGLPNDLYGIKRPALSFKEILDKKKVNYVSYYSFRKPKLNNLKVEVIAEVIGLQEVMILENQMELVLIKERINASQINWKKDNLYWIDPKTYFLWKSIQHLSPKLPPLKIEVTKKPAD